MHNLEGTAEVQCGKCSNVITIDAPDMYMDFVGAEERQMGPELKWESILDIGCPKCQEDIQVHYEMWEYPEGILNHEERNVENGKILQWFSLVPFYEYDEIFNFEENINLYLPKNDIYAPQTPIISLLGSSTSRLIQYLSENPEAMYKIDPREFEEIVAEIFSKNGFQTELTKKTRDGGRDIIALKTDFGIPTKYLIECKRYAKDRPISVDLVRNLYGVHCQEGANKSLLVTTSSFTPDAKSFVSNPSNTLWHMGLKEYNDVVGWLKNYKS